ncbi:hypothetical protein RQP46_008617 [Phenoliferia psychrophenolica]
MSYNNSQYDTYAPEAYGATATSTSSASSRPSPPHPTYSPYQVPSSLPQEYSSSSSSDNTNSHWHADQLPFNPSEHTSVPPGNFDPGLFSSDFVPPRFTTGFSSGPFANGPTVVDSLDSQRRPGMLSSSVSGGGSFSSESYANSSSGDDAFASSSATTASSASPRDFMGPPPIPMSFNSSLFSRRQSHPPPIGSHQQRQPQPSLHQQQQPQRRQRPVQGGLTDPSSAIYDLYGSSVISIQPTFDALKIAPLQQAYDPAALGLPLPPAPGTGEKNYRGLYSTSGLDMIGILARVAARPKPEIEIGPIDLGCSFLVTDARKFDNPIVYASDNFSTLTGYSNHEIIGQNCRFLQSPDGIVEQGEKRRYTDGNAVDHLKRHINSGRETQASLINYAKGGKPFINLVTCIPITWDSSEIAYFVGFQVDLVDQPSAILEKMKNGTYVVNYSVGGNGHGGTSIPRNPSIASTPSTTTKYDEEMKPVKRKESTDSLSILGTSTGTAAPVPPMSLFDQVETSAHSNGELIDAVLKDGFASITNTAKRTQFNRLLLENCDDFIHVVSLKGSLLYVSPSAARLLEYEPSELAGTMLSSICHPSDIVAVLRELKEAGAPGHTGVNVLYRLRRKRSGYVWLEAAGKLFHEQAKGRKCVILVGRPREVLQVSWKELEKAGGLGEKEYWSKLSFDGMQLHTTPPVKDVLGYSPEDLMGTNVSALDQDGTLVAVLRAMASAPTQEMKTVRHRMKGLHGILDVITNLYPSGAIDASGSRKSSSPTIIAQTSIAPAEGAPTRPIASLPSPMHRSASASSTSSSQQRPQTLYSLPVAAFRGARGSDGESSSGSSASSFSAIPSTFKTLTTASSDNIFDELEETRGTSWQFELQSLRSTNRKLQEEKEALAALQRKKRKRESRPAGLEPAVVKPSGPRACANCGRTNSAEWRSGPTGPKSLCNACGLRWSKALSFTSINSVMRTTLTLLALVALVAGRASPRHSRLDKRFSVLSGQWDTETEGDDYLLYNDLWGEASGTGCVRLHFLTGTARLGVTLSSVGSIPSTWAWSYTEASSSLVADVSYDLWLSNEASCGTSSSCSTYEIMIWLSARGGAGPAGTYTKTVTIGGSSWKVSVGTVSTWNIISFVAVDEITDFDMDLMEFFDYLEANNGVSSSQYLTAIQAGTEPFTGSATLTTSKYSSSVVAAVDIVSSSSSAKTSSATVKATTSASTTVKPTTTLKLTTTKSAKTSSAAKASATSSTCAGSYGQCGGASFSGPTCCVSGWTCTVQNEWYSQCVQ